jgi:hypothetical protein
LKHVKLDGSIVDYLTTNNFADLESEDADELGALPGSILSAGDSLHKQQSPFPFALMDTGMEQKPRVISRNLYSKNKCLNL